MTTFSLPFGYRLPLLAEPTAGPIFIQPNTNPYASEYTIPLHTAQEAPEVVYCLNEIERMTRWTNRTFAEIIGVTHPTLSKALRGDVGALSRSHEARQRIADVYAVVQRLYLLAARSAERLAIALDIPDAADNTAIDYLVERKIPQAYLAAARALQPPRREGMMKGSHPLDPRRAIVAVPDED